MFCTGRRRLTLPRGLHRADRWRPQAALLAEGSPYQAGKCRKRWQGGAQAERQNSILSPLFVHSVTHASTSPLTLMNCVGPDQFVAMTGTSMAIASKQGQRGRPLSTRSLAPPTCPFPHKAPRPMPDAPSMSGLHQPSPCVASTNASAATSICWYLETTRSPWRGGVMRRTHWSGGNTKRRA